MESEVQRRVDLSDGDGVQWTLFELFFFLYQSACSTHMPISRKVSMVACARTVTSGLYYQEEVLSKNVYVIRIRAAGRW